MSRSAMPEDRRRDAVVFELLLNFQERQKYFHVDGLHRIFPFFLLVLAAGGVGGLQFFRNVVTNRYTGLDETLALLENGETWGVIRKKVTDRSEKYHFEDNFAYKVHHQLSHFRELTPWESDVAKLAGKVAYRAYIGNLDFGKALKETYMSHSLDCPE